MTMIKYAHSPPINKSSAVPDNTLSQMFKLVCFYSSLECGLLSNIKRYYCGRYVSSKLLKACKN